MDMPQRRQKPAENRPVDDHKEMGLLAVERLRSETPQIYAAIDAQTTWTATEKLAHFHQILGVFGSWFLAPMPQETRIAMLTKMAESAERAASQRVVSPQIFN